MRMRDQSGAVSPKAIIWLSMLFILVGSVVGCDAVVRYRFKRARAEWKTTALGRLAGLSYTNENINRELERLKASRTTAKDQDWAGEHVLLMTNDQYLVYAFWHGFNTGPVDHLFLARGSDGHWYYSTYHFCNSMAGVMEDDPPGSIAEFATTYSAREFDGKSDVCLQRTWPEKKKD